MKSSTSKAAWYTTLAAGTAAAPTALGAIVYTDVVPDITGSAVAWDLDNGGQVDFTLKVDASSSLQKSNLAQSGQAAGIALFPNGNVDQLTAGETIGSTSTFSNRTDTKTLFDQNTPADYDWSAGERGFLGLRIDLGGAIHNGWADVSINAAGPSLNHTLYAYAYEATPDADIVAGAVPEPSLATLFIAGAAGVASMRRRRG